MGNNHFLCAFVVVAAFALLPSCMSGQQKVLVASDTQTTKRVELSDVKSIKVCSGIDAVYVQTASGSPYAEICGPDNYIECVTLNAKGGDLVIGLKCPKGYNGFQWKNEEFYVKVYDTEVTSFTTESGSSLALEKSLATQHAIAISSGSGSDIRAGMIDCAGFAIECGSAGSVEVDAVKCADASVALSSASKCNLASLTCQSLDASLGSASKFSAGKVEGGNVVIASDSGSSADVQGIDVQQLVVAVGSGSRITLAGRCDDAHLTAGSGADIDAGSLTAQHTSSSAHSGGSIVSPSRH